MKKWILIGIILLTAAIGGATLVYWNATEPLRNSEKKAIQIAARETDFSDSQNFQLYNGEETYYTLTAKNSKNEDVYLWISEKGNNIFTEKIKDGVTRDEALERVFADRNPEEIISVRLGITRIQKTDRPAWEIYYRTENDHINYYYVDFETGEKLRAIDNF